jgi:putative SOS response-associated peptidase YedK
MCQRYVVPHQAAAEREFLPANAWWNFAPKFNVSVGQYVPAIRLHEDQSEGVMVRWGLIPSWVEGTPDGRKRACAHESRIETSRSCKTAWVNGQRCILPMGGFYCWQLTAAGYRQPYFVRLEDRSAFGVAGLWDRWTSEEDDVIESCALVTVRANELVSQIAGSMSGMPAILRRKDYDLWLRGKPGEAKEALRPYTARWMQAYPVSPRVNSADIDDPTLIRAAG